MKDRKPLDSTESAARRISEKEDGPWYIMLRRGSNDVVVPECELSRMMRIGYKTACVWFRGKRYKDILCLSDGVHFVTE